MTKRIRRADDKAASNRRPARSTKPNLGAKTWGEIKTMIEAEGVTNDDPVFMVDIGPDPKKIFVSRDYVGQVEISDWA
jgi:hypothetical protein